MIDLIIIGYGGHARGIKDSIEKNTTFYFRGYIVQKCLTGESGECLGDDENLSDIYKDGIHNAFIGIGYLGNSNIRDKKYAQLKKIGYTLPVIIDPSAIVAESVEIGEGAYIGKGAIINANVKIGKCAIINTGAIVEHDSVIGDFSHVAVGTIVCGGVTIADHALVGANATVLQCLNIGSNSIVAAGAVVRKNIEDNITFYG